MKHPDRNFHGLFGLMHQMLQPDKLDLGFTYITSKVKINFNQSKLFNSTNFTDIIYNPFAGLEYESETTAYIIAFNMTWFF